MEYVACHVLCVGYRVFIARKVSIQTRCQWFILPRGPDYVPESCSDGSIGFLFLFLFLGDKNHSAESVSDPSCVDLTHSTKKQCRVCTHS